MVADLFRKAHDVRAPGAVPDSSRLCAINTPRSRRAHPAKAEAENENGRVNSMPWVRFAIAQRMWCAEANEVRLMLSEPGFVEPVFI